MKNLNKLFTRCSLVSKFTLIFVVLLLTACGGSDIEPGDTLLTCNVPNVPNAAGSACVPPPPISCPAPTVPNASNDACVVGFNENLPDPVFAPSAQQAVLYYNRADVDADNSANDKAYEGWRLHTWNNDACDAYADADTQWANGRVHDGIDPTYGAYWILDLKDGHDNCHNFIIHIGTDDAGKELGGGDFSAKLDQDDPRFARMNFTLSGEPRVFEFPIDSLGEQPVKIEGAQAHWLDTDVLLWNVDFSVVSSVKLHYSENADMEITLEDGVINSTAIELTESALTESQQMIAPHLSGLPAFMGTWSAEDAKAVLKTQVILGAYDVDGKLVAATGVQIPNVLDQLYTAGQNDADEAVLGAFYENGSIHANLWAPTAINVMLNLYGEDKRLVTSHQMDADTATGIWSLSLGEEADRQLYRYEITVYHPVTGKIEVLEVTDPYSLSLSTNGRFSQFVNLNDDDLKPDGWETHTIPTVENFEDIVIYEGHVRDFSIRDQSTSEANRGKYLAFTEKSSLPMQHLTSLAEAGVTHFHVLPVNDIATVNEDSARSIDWTSTVQSFCALVPAAQVCNDGTDKSQTIAALYQSFDVLTNPGAAQVLTEQIRGVDQFNWGYDPKHFSAPEGSYASDPEGVARIIELREMVQGLHEVGLRVALDVVYNHTNASGVFANSVLDKVVPGYYHRYTINEGSIVRETCCDDTEPRNRMMEKLMEDSLTMWASQYKFDSFRFDIMSQASKTTMVNLFDAVKSIDPDTYFYGEGWGKNTSSYGDFEIASQFNMAGTEIGTFNDRIREAVRQGNIFARESSDAALNDQDRVKMSLAGTLTDFVINTRSGNDSETSALGGYALDPADIINYVSKHDNETLWDQFNYVLPDDLSLLERVRAQNVAQGINLMSQGIPFLQMGGDFLRSKSMDRNTFDAGDWFNYVDFTMETNNWNVGLPLAQDNEGRWTEISQFMNSPERASSMTEIEFAATIFKEFLSIRSSSPLFRLTTADDIKRRVGFHNLGSDQQQGLIAMSIDDGISISEDQASLIDLDPNYDALMVIINTGYQEKSIDVRTASNFDLHPVLINSIDPDVRSASYIDTSTDEQVAGSFAVPPLTIAVFVKHQGDAQGLGLSAFATIGAPDIVPFGDTNVFLRGSLNGWSEDNPMEYLGDGVYQVSAILVGGEEIEFKIASADWATVNLGNDNGGVDEGIIKGLESGQGNMRFTPLLDGTYVFTVNASSVSTPTLLITNEEPFVGMPIFVRGGMNGWGTTDELAYQGSGVYAITLDLDAQDYQFKIANADWAMPNLGSVSDDIDDNIIQLGQALPLLENGGNLNLSISEAGSYVFVLDVSDVNAPLVSVYNAAFFAETTVFIRGDMNGWGTDDALVWDSGSYIVDVSLDAGSYNFKVASEDWATFNFGGEDGNSNVLVGSDFSLSGGNNPPNLLINVEEAGRYRFTVSGLNPKSPQLTVLKL